MIFKSPHSPYVLMPFHPVPFPTKLWERVAWTDCFCFLSFLSILNPFHLSFHLQQSAEMTPIKLPVVKSSVHFSGLFYWISWQFSLLVFLLLQSLLLDTSLSKVEGLGSVALVRPRPLSILFLSLSNRLLDLNIIAMQWSLDLSFQPWLLPCAPGSFVSCFLIMCSWTLVLES